MVFSKYNYPLNAIACINGGDLEDKDSVFSAEEIERIKNSEFLSADFEFVVNTEPKFDDRDRKIVELYFKENCTYETIGGRLGISRARVGQKLTAILRTLRRSPNKEKLAMGVNNYYNAQIAEAFEKAYKQGVTDGYAKACTEGRKAEKNPFIISEVSSLEIKDVLENGGMSIRLYNCLTRGGVSTVKQLVSMKPHEVVTLRNLGLKSINEIIEVLERYGFDASGYYIYTTGDYKALARREKNDTP